METQMTIRTDIGQSLAKRLHTALADNNTRAA